MIHPSKRLLLAIESVLDIAYFGNMGPVQSGDMANRQGIPRRYLEQVLQHLVRCGLIVGHRGPRGGYQLAKERGTISLGDVARAVRDFEGNRDPIEMAQGSQVGTKIVRPLWREMQKKMVAELDSITLEELCQQARAAGISANSEPKLDFSI